MPAHRRLWPLLAYGALGALAFARQGEPRSARAFRSRRMRHGEEGCRQASGDTRGSEHFEREHGRGRHATAPWEIPWRGWKDILWRTYGKINDNRLLAVAAGVVFYSLLALFPAISAFVSLFGLFANPSTIDSACRR